MRRHKRTLSIGEISIAIGVALIPVLASSSQEPGRGKMIYERHCVVCHGSEGKGDGELSRVLRSLPTDFTSAAFKNKSDREVLDAIDDGVMGSAMPAWKGSFSEEEMREVVAYIRSLAR
jgi:mono/diheme cytochrome c family protein